MVPFTGPLNTIGVMATSEHLVWLAGVATAVGVGSTSTVAVIDGPGQPFADGVMVKVTVTGAEVVLINVPLISPLPLAAIPVTLTVLSLVQVYVVPLTAPLNAIVVIATPEHFVWLDGVATAVGVGSTSTVAVIGVPGQPFAEGVMVKVTVTGNEVVLISVPLIFPLPLAAIPVTLTVLSLAQV